MIMTWIRRKKWWVLAAVAVLVGGGVTLGFLVGGSSSEGVGKNAEAQTYVVERGNIETSLTAYGSVVAAQEYTFTFDGDDVKEMHVSEGHRVDEGDVLVELDRTQAELNLLQAERMVREAEAEGVPNTIRERELAYQIALETYAKTTLEAPFAGVVTRIVQATSSSEKWSLKLIDTRELFIEADVDQLDAPDVAVGQNAEAIIEPLGDDVWAVELVEVGGIASKSGNSTVVSVTARLPEADPRILVGYTAEMEIITAQAIDVLIAPITCLTESPRGWMVTKVVDGEEYRTPVTIGAMSDQYAEITSGLEEGDVLLLNSPVVPDRPADMTEEQREELRKRLPGGNPGTGGFPGMP